MLEAIGWNWFLDGWIVLAGILCAVSASLLGNFLVLRRMSMLGDAISHAILPGLAAAFFISGSRSSLPMFVGAVIVGILTALFTEWIRGIGKVDEGASMGVVFTSLFALGLIMIVQAADHVDLDPGCVLYGAIELTPLDTVEIAGTFVPRVVAMLGCVLVVNLAFVVLFFKELKISSFDPALSTASGIHAGVMHYLLMTLVAVTAVASFESVGNILVVAMFVVPPAAACLCTDRLGVMILLSAVFAAFSAVCGHLGALTVPALFGYRSTTTAGMMAVAAGLLFLVVALVAPRHGVLARLIRRRLLSWQILTEDVIALLYRFEERQHAQPPDRATMADLLMVGPLGLLLAIRRLERSGVLNRAGDGYRLTPEGIRRGRELVRTHRLWEHYLVQEAQLPAERIHDKAERLEHFTDAAMRVRLDRATDAPQTDPHGTPIPPEAANGDNADAARR
ncbi:Manganese transport system membrane protein MntB [Maioricimonas rarisocia]|uniref:Manganese transport system membrane protein MntB n=1 Tax=Maioricimonas rarisocia TaxID=2528026 RepID=A0A517Z9U4_9PLAN|nr:metal ABC transporter permease [Maioricimonas rarisocia]QDU39256.1 Manganese transport system membrane protein MntB [Maioricimonas rarisocia]